MFPSPQASSTAGFSEPEQLTQRKSKRLIEGFVCNPLFVKAFGVRSILKSNVTVNERYRLFWTIITRRVRDDSRYTACDRLALAWHLRIGEHHRNS